MPSSPSTCALIVFLFPAARTAHGVPSRSVRVTEGAGATAAAATGDDDGLSSGTAAIIGVVVAAVVLCAVVAGLFYRMGKKRSSAAAEEQTQEGEQPEQEANLDGYASDEDVQL